MNTNHYMTDRRLGDICIINDKDVYEHFNADLLSFSLVSGSLSQDTLSSVGKHNFTLLYQDYVSGSLEISFYVGGANRNDRDINCSRLLRECKTCIIKREEEDFEYASILDSFEIEETGVDYWNLVKLKLLSVKRYSLVRHKIVSELCKVSAQGIEYTFENIGTISSGLRIIVVSSVEKQSVIVNGITVDNLLSNKYYVIDGINGIVTEDGINCYAKTDLLEFPKVEPGTNAFRISTLENMEVYIEFYPVFMI